MVDTVCQSISATLAFLARGFMAGMPAWVLICARFVWIWSIEALIVCSCPSNPVTFRIGFGQASKTAFETLFSKTKPNMLYPNSSWRLHLTRENSFRTRNSSKAA